MANSIFFHEDAYCQIELVPINNVFTKQQELDLADRHYDENFTGNGLLDISIREPTKYPLSDLGIIKADLESLLSEKSLFAFDKVYSGYSTHRALMHNIFGFGYENFVLYYKVNHDLLTDIWVDYNFFSDTLNRYPERLQEALLTLGTAYEIVLIDWNEMIIVTLKNENHIKNYLNEIIS